ncbi:nucleotide disphospho-sugar-binding domain-containing protein [Amycolatopsis cihanbeyliensis]|uniref:Glycosyltransferase/glycosyltransferase n=1 Tax=Amycolatopsis cihanbeyliensis TaxID=1128664 RepID=A0A542DSD0_AMYCI|nr:nucleotide disphospho-sugar-binding domain-containing protein [Amycolatopsis cihanbeyliensis]TQJ05905.1 glycosyltransferase/glycosyltransferase [Amycolatopsis cihanbeyliensis]
MKVLFVPGNSPYPIFSHAPLATAVRNAGHQVLMGGIEWVLPRIASVGLPPVKISPLSIEEVSAFVGSMPEDPVEQAKAVGGVYAEIAINSLEPLLELSEHWRPDIVVGGGMFYCAPLLAHHLGVPSVRLEWDRIDARMYDPGAIEVLQPLLAELNLAQVPAPDLWLGVCPPSLLPPDAVPAQPMRWIPANPQQPLEQWMYAKGDRPRVYLTAGTRLFSGDALLEMIRNLSGLNVEIVVGAPEQIAEELRADLPGVRIGWVPLDILAPTCDIIIHHGGGGTDMTALNAGVPQLIANPEYPTAATQQVVDYGAALTLTSDEQRPENIVAACNDLLSNPGYGERARELSREIAALPAPAEIVPVMEKLAG